MKIHSAWIVSTMLFGLVHGAQAAGVFRCPDGSYQDKPCGEGQKLVTTTQRLGDKPIAGSCTDIAALAERTAKAKAKGIMVEQALKEIDKSAVPYELAVKRKKAIVQAYRIDGAPIEVRTLVEAQCVQEQADAQRVAVAASDANPMAPQKTLDSNKARQKELEAQATMMESKANSRSTSVCEDYREELEDIKRKLRNGGSGSTMDGLNAERRDIESKIWSKCG